MADPLQALPDALRHALLRRVPATLPDADAMRRRLWRAVKDAERARSRNPFVNLPLAREIAERLEALVDRTADGTDVQRGLVAAAIAYFATHDEHFEGAFGFDDDAAMVGAVEEALEEDAAAAEPRAAR